MLKLVPLTNSGKFARAHTHSGECDEYMQVFANTAIYSGTCLTHREGLNNKKEGDKAIPFPLLGLCKRNDNTEHLGNGKRVPTPRISAKSTITATKSTITQNFAPKLGRPAAPPHQCSSKHYRYATWPYIPHGPISHMA